MNNNKLYNLFFSFSLICILSSCNLSQERTIKDINNLISKGVKEIDNNPNGVTAYNFFRSAELLYEGNKLNDTLLLSTIYSNIAKINYNVGNYSQAKEYAVKRHNLNHSIKNDSLNLAAQIDYSYIEIALSEFNNARDLIDELTLKYKVPHNFNNSIFALEAIYFEIIGDYDLAIEFYRAVNVKSMKDSVERDLFLARNFFNAKNIDSAKFYIDNLLKNVDDKEFNDSFLHYNLAASIYTKNRDYKRATELYATISKLYSKDIDKAWDNKILESEIKYGVLESEQQILKLKEFSYKLTLLFTFIISIILILYIILRNANKRGELKLKINETKLENIELIKKLMEVSLEHLPTFQEDVYNLVARNQKASNEIMPEYIAISSDMKKRIKKKFSTIIDEPAIANINPIFSKMSEYTTTEKMIVYLLFLNYNSSFIARVLQTSPGSIRGTKANIKKRTIASVVLSEEEKSQIFNILE